MMRIIYVAHPVSGDVVHNLLRAKDTLRGLFTMHPSMHFIAPWITECEIFLDVAKAHCPNAGPDHPDATSYYEALRRCCAVIERCDELWLCGGHITTGMRIEAIHAREHGIEVNNLSGDPTWPELGA